MRQCISRSAQTSGLDGVSKHRDPSKQTPAQAYSFTRGEDAHRAPGHEQRLHHDAWRVPRRPEMSARAEVQMAGGGESRPMRHVGAHHDSPIPAPAQAVTRASVHHAKDREQHLPHEAWHVPRAAAGRRTKPGVQMVRGEHVDEAPRPQREAGPMGHRIGDAATPGGSGLPSTLKAGVEALSGMTMDHVRVHRDSPKPAGIQAYAYAQGSDIHLGPGQERHLPHEAWHVVQQAQGRVQPTMQMAGGWEINDDQGLEREAEVMGARAQSDGAPGRAADHPPVRQARQGGPSTVQRVSHGFLGTMIHYAREDGVDPPEPGPNAPKKWKKPDEIDADNWRVYWHGGNLVEPRGQIVDGTGKTYDWGFTTLENKLTAMRRKAGYDAQSFPIVINANHMISPGVGKTPASAENQQDGIYAFGSVWSMIFTAPGDKDTLLPFSAALGAWKEAGDEKTAKRGKAPTKKLNDDQVKQLLWTAAKQKVEEEGRNVATPHRGLRNAIFDFSETDIQLNRLEKDYDVVHVITLDSDVDFDEGSVLREIERLAEQDFSEPTVGASEEQTVGTSDKQTGGASGAAPKPDFHLTATDYIYSRTGFFAWFAGVLDKYGRMRLEQKGLDPYPAEPGLTISYASSSKMAARPFLKSRPFGPEVGDEPLLDTAEGGSNEKGEIREDKADKAKDKKGKDREGSEAVSGGDPFKELVESEQSVEGKNLRERYRRAIGNPAAPVIRTKGFLSVSESKSQFKPPTKTIKELARKKDITAEDLKKLIQSDSYHSLLAARGKNNSDASESKKTEVKEIFKDAAAALTNALKEVNYSTEAATLRPRVLKALFEPGQEQDAASGSGTSSGGSQAAKRRRSEENDESSTSTTSTDASTSDNIRIAMDTDDAAAEEKIEQGKEKKRRTSGGSKGDEGEQTKSEEEEQDEKMTVD